MILNKHKKYIMKPKPKKTKAKKHTGNIRAISGHFWSCISCWWQVAVAVVFHSLYTPLKGGYQACLYKWCWTEQRSVSHQTLW